MISDLVSTILEKKFRMEANVKTRKTIIVTVNYFYVRYCNIVNVQLQNPFYLIKTKDQQNYRFTVLYIKQTKQTKAILNLQINKSYQ